MNPFKAIGEVTQDTVDTYRPVAATIKTGAQAAHVGMLRVLDEAMKDDDENYIDLSATVSHYQACIGSLD